MMDRREQPRRKETVMQTGISIAKEIRGIYQAGSQHMVGDGFPVRNMIPGAGVEEQLSPFLLLDYLGPEQFPPATRQLGVGEHPHRGFETVTLMYHGKVAHRDSTGSGGVIGPGDVQWMTAASGIVHEELHEKEFSEQGGLLEGIQLWVNLPKAFKMSPPRYQTLVSKDIPTVDLGEGAGQLRVIAGEFRGIKGPAKTFSPVHLYDLRLKAGHRMDLSLPEGFNSSLFVLHGQAVMNGSGTVREVEIALLGQKGERVTIEAKKDATILVMSGEPIVEPIARYGPFVMNTRDELIQAAQDYQAGKMGHLS
jgi:redox-sensitive bicupin YhaK (pirin superfamily)